MWGNSTVGQECSRGNGPLGSYRGSVLIPGTKRIDPTENQERGSDIEKGSIYGFHSICSLGIETWIRDCGGYEENTVAYGHSCCRSIRSWF